MHYYKTGVNGKITLYNFSMLKYNWAILNNRKGKIVMKKLFALCLVVALMVSCFAGCGANDNSVDPMKDMLSYADAEDQKDAQVQKDNVVSDSTNTDSDMAYVQNKGTLIVGITDYAPMDFKDENGEWTGFDAEFARFFGEKLGVEVVFQEIQWSSKFFELEGKTIDCIWNGMTISDEVLLNTNCSDAYVKNAQVIVMKANRAEEYGSGADLMFAAEEGSAGEQALKDNGIANYIPVYDQATAMMEVAAGTADACVIDLTMANAMTGEGTSYADLTIVAELTSEVYGVGFRKGSNMTAEFNAVMKELMNDGTLDALAEKYQLTLVKGE